MQGCILKTRAGGFAILVAIVVAGCQTPGGSPTSVSGSRAAAQAEKLARDGQFAAAAQAYEDLAAQSAPELRSRFLLRAAHDWLRAENLPRGDTALRQVGDDLPPADQNLRRMVAARAALLGQHPDRALQELDRIPHPLPRDEAPEILELRSRALFAYGNPAGAVITALDREQLLSEQNDVMRNRRMIWDGIQRNVAAGVNMQAPVGASRQVAGWMELGRAALVTARNPFAAQAALDEWRSRYPEHAANEFLTQQVVPQLQTAVTYPTHLALLLPLSGRNQAVGVAVRDGLMASLMQQNADQRPLLRLYDTAGGAVPAYTQAVADGAKFIIGPLLREDVAALAQSQQVTVPTLALNLPPDDAPASANLYGFALDPVEEAQQVAERILAEGLTHGIALLPKNEKGERIHRAFAAELAQRGGALTDVRFYDPAAVDFTAPVTTALLINESRARANAVNAAVGAKLEFEPRARSDVEFVFISAEPHKGRLLRPALRFHMRDSVPIFATSDIFVPDTRANVDLNDVIFPDMPWMIAPDELSAQLRAMLNQYWPARARDRARLYAFGFDAYRLAPLVMSQSSPAPTNETTGMTGRLSIDAARRVRRDLDWARIANGTPQLLEQTLRSQPIQAAPPPIAAAGP